MMRRVPDFVWGGGEFEYGSWDLETGDAFDEEDEGDADE